MKIVMRIVAVSILFNGLTWAGVINVPGDEPTIQAGINAATSGVDEVVVAPGTYSEAINFNGKAITVRSANGAWVTNIRGNNNNSVVTCNSGEGANTLLQGFTLSNGGGSQGGGMRNLNTSPTVIACIFRNNTTSIDGGGVFNQNGANPTFINCLFYSNFTSGKGGAIYNDNSNLVIINCTFSNNQGNFGGAIWSQSGSPTISNSIIWDNTPNSNQIDGSIGLVTLTFSDLQNVWTGGGGNNISVSPEFVNPVGLDYHLGQSSPCIDAGDNAVVPGSITTDLDGDLRFRDVPLTPDTGQGSPPIVDMGAYEPFADCNGNGIPDDQDPDADGDLIPDDCDVCPGFDDLLDTDGDGVPNGCDLCPGTPPGPVGPDGCAPIENITTGVQYQSIQAAIDEALDGDEIVCRSRTYFASIDFLGKAITLRSASGDPNDTIINGTGHFHVVQCVNGEDPNTVLSGFTITGGNADTSGGGMFNGIGTSPTVTNCIFSGNSAIDEGGGMFNNFGSSPTVVHCIFNGNSAGKGGGMYNLSESTPTVTNCTFNDNSADTFGGGMSNAFSIPTVTNCVFSNNSASSGGGMSNSNKSPTVANCTFSGNSAEIDGGGMFNNGSSPTVTDCTFSTNVAEFGGGMENNFSNPIVTDCTFNINVADFGGGMENTSSNPTVTNCVFTGNSAAIGFGETGYGGGMFNGNSNPTVIDCTFSTNVAEFGGGMENFIDSSPIVINCTFSDNSATTGSGGGMHNYIDSIPTVTNCTFSGNSAEAHGGGLYSIDSTPTVTGCSFSGNSATRDGGGMYNNNSSSTVTNCTFSGNSAIVEGGGMFNDFGSSPTVNNCILWGNSDEGGMDESAQIHIDSGTPTVNYSDLQGGWTGAGGVGNLNVEPLFVDANGVDNVIGTDDDDLRLQAGSPCIDAGNSFLASSFPFDLDGHQRIVDDQATIDTGVGFPEVIDMGAYEFGSSLVPCLPQIEGDINCDGIVDMFDLALMAANWLVTI